jgi:hypothetical protein
MAALVQHSPSWIRSGEFGLAVKRWTEISNTDPAPTPRISSDQSTLHAVADGRLHQTGDPIPSTSNTHRAVEHFVRSDSVHSTPISYPSIRYASKDESNSPFSSPIFRQSTAQVSLSTPPLSPLDSLAASADSIDPSLYGDRIETQYGGVFYLVNVALALDYYGDFAAPAHRGLALTLWDFLAIFGERFVGLAFSGDPVSTMLTRLSGRTDEEPAGVAFEPPNGEPLGNWLVSTETQMRHRLGSALDIHEPDALRTLLFQQNAKICVTATRVDVTYSLSEHPIELRLAGLDRDPGWIPAGGRILAFHYE